MSSESGYIQPLTMSSHAFYQVCGNSGYVALDDSEISLEEFLELLSEVKKKFDLEDSQIRLEAYEYTSPPVIWISWSK